MATLDSSDPPFSRRAPASSPASSSVAHHPLAAADSLRYCIFTTIALLAWLLGPPLVVSWMAGLGLAAYVRGWRAGIRRSKCFLRDVRLVIGYLALSLAVGGTFAIIQAVRWVGRA